MIRIRTCFALLLIGALAASVAFGMSEGPKPESSPPKEGSMPSASGNTQPQGLRPEAERSYALAYEEIAKAKKDLEDGKAKNADKRFKKALERMENAVSLDSTYHEAWNLLGYAARKTGDYDKAFRAYDKCLSIEPTYAPAREYLGEAWLEKNDLTKARAQLIVLERQNAESQESKTLHAAIDAYVTAHPETAKAADTAPADSTSAKSVVR